MRSNPFVRASCLLLILALLLGASAFSAAAKLAGSEVRIGVIIPTSGYIVFFGNQQLLALRIAEEEINAAGGIGGLPMKLIVYDTASKGETAIAVTKKLIDTDKVLAIIGPLLSSNAEVTFPVANRAKISIISAASAAPGISARNRPWGFRNTSTSDKVSGPAIKKWVEMHGIKSVGIVTDVKSVVSKIYGKQVAPTLLAQHGVKVIESIDIMTTDMDFSAQVTKLKAAKPDGIVLAGEFFLAANIAREVRRQEMKQPFLGDVTISGTQYVELGGKATEGTIAASDWWPAKPDARVQAFVEKFKARDPKKQDPHTVAASMYDTIYITKRFIETGGVTNKPEDLAGDRERIRDGWANLKDYAGIMGQTTINSDGDGVKELYILMVKDGKYVRLAD
ncbi:MAG: ABC transporter substrate-binding protein [Candidatus Tectomicrobia bacterium]|nr:ABC transporter substrate-binding protein [Candidatus Tectomicrobia bacterium]